MNASAPSPRKRRLRRSSSAEETTPVMPLPPRTIRPPSRRRAEEAPSRATSSEPAFAQVPLGGTFAAVCVLTRRGKTAKVHTAAHTSSVCLRSLSCFSLLLFGLMWSGPWVLLGYGGGGFALWLQRKVGLTAPPLQKQKCAAWFRGKSDVRHCVVARVVIKTAGEIARKAVNAAENDVGDRVDRTKGTAGYVKFRTPGVRTRPCRIRS